MLSRPRPSAATSMSSMASSTNEIPSSAISSASKPLLASLRAPARRDHGSAAAVSKRLGARRSFVHLPVLADEADRDRVHDQRDHEQQRPDGEDRLVLRCSRSARSPLPVARCTRSSSRSARAGSAVRFGDLAGGDQHDHRLADGARGAEHDRRRRCPRARPGRRPAARSAAGCAEPERALAQRRRAPPTSRPRRSTRWSA